MADDWDAFLADYYRDIERKMPRLPNMPSYDIASIAQKSYKEARESLGIADITVDILRSRLYNAKGILDLEFLTKTSPAFRDFKTDYDSRARRLAVEHKRLSRLRDGINAVPKHNTPTDSLLAPNTVNIANTQEEPVSPANSTPANQNYEQPKPNVALEMKLETLHEIKKSIEDGFFSAWRWLTFYSLAGIATMGIAYTQLDDSLESQRKGNPKTNSSVQAVDYTTKFIALEFQLRELTKRQTTPSVIVTGTQELADRLSTLESNVATALRSIPREINSTQVQEMNQKIASVSQAIQSIPPSVQSTEIQRIYQILDSLSESIKRKPAQTTATVTKIVQDPALLKEIQTLREQNQSIKMQYEKLKNLKPQPRADPSPKPSAKPNSKLENALDDAEY